MNESLTSWVSAADASIHLADMRVVQGTLDIDHIQNRFDDYYISLVGELFRKLRANEVPDDSWAHLANALAQIRRLVLQTQRWESEVNANEALLFAAAAFYIGGFPAAAYLVASEINPAQLVDEDQASLDLLVRRNPQSDFATNLFQNVRQNDAATFQSSLEFLRSEVDLSLQRGPASFISLRLLLALTLRFSRANVRTVLSAEPGDWDVLVRSFVSRVNPTWEFFPSQIEAIEKGILRDERSFSLQMPTGSGKTTLCETILFGHLNSRPNDAALLLVPFRSIASELKATLVANLNRMNIASQSMYGGNVPSAGEVRALAEIRAMVATPESISGLLGADAAFARRISLVICDEGHLLDGGQRGIALELLLARLRARVSGSPKIIFISAIVPNIQEINAWLGGTNETVVVSSYRPSIAEFATLVSEGTGANEVVSMRLHPHLEEPFRFDIERFLDRENFRYINPSTGRPKTYSFGSFKTKAVAAARKTLPIGLVAVFAANKKGMQGVVGLSEELVSQLESPLNLPSPLEYVDQDRLAAAADYFNREFGPAWIGTRALLAGAAIHHGDIPQESREVVERLLRESALRLVFCTSTLAEGVNLPIRTLVLYSVQRVEPGGTRTSLLARDIKNLVGRAGRAGSTTKGLVICVNEGQWGDIEPVATQGAMEPVNGALRTFLEALRTRLVVQNLQLTQDLLEAADADRETLALVDGVDAVLVELAAEELGTQTLAEVAAAVAEASFAATGVDSGAKLLLKDVFVLRATRIDELKASGRLEWVRTRGAKARFISSVETGLFGLRGDWETVSDAVAAGVLTTLLDWAWTHFELKVSTCEAFNLSADNEEEVAAAKVQLSVLAHFWSAGASYTELAGALGVDVDRLLTVVTQALGFSLISILDQGIAILENLVEGGLSNSVKSLVEKLRYGVPNESAVALVQKGVRHRTAAIMLSRSPEVIAATSVFPPVRPEVAASDAMRNDPDGWRERLGELVYENTLSDLPATS
ncbi:MAG: DEAD/DEAH box helicase [Polaromonas sp.]|uniref:DEAD/DEAH box helicase n=1 Tax=Polaromonas sp. TaxID=1869339 RepID=UPI002727A87B|nr:DEAD/DEAH box helicase [Polaromonas sp.]MDO9114971.1 DEAD/DEAH box helicase [Polaromonas sp.]MDP1885559.1 DEAD/DEAH box helicase [Polaromonas sp.]